jgi:nucleotide-binding universal stress UspA family protein
MSSVAGADVVVGADGSEHSLAAIRVAAAEAVKRGRTLRIVHAFIWPLLGVATGPPRDGPPGLGLRHAAENLLAEASGEAQKAAPDVRVTTELVDGAAATVLVHASSSADLLVIGDRGLGGFSGLLLGSVAVQVVEHATCPVLVIRGADRPGGPVVVGVDGAVSTPAIGFAMQEASRLGVALTAVHVWNSPVSAGPGDMLPLVFDPAALEDEERRVLSESLAGWAEQYPDVDIRFELVRGHPAHRLIEWSTSAQLVVVGARGRGGFAGLLLGSVSQALIHHAACRVAVVRAGPIEA